MKLQLEIDFTSDSTIVGMCGCGRWKSVVYDVSEREQLFEAWGIHCQARHRPRGVDAMGDG